MKYFKDTGCEPIKFNDVKEGDYFFGRETNSSEPDTLYRKLHFSVTGTPGSTDPSGKMNCMEMSTGFLATFGADLVYVAEQTEPAKFRRVKGDE